MSGCALSLSGPAMVARCMGTCRGATAAEGVRDTYVAVRRPPSDPRHTVPAEVRLSGRRGLFVPVNAVRILYSR